MTITQQLNHVNENNYDDDITVDGLKKGQFIAVISNTYDDGNGTRTIEVAIMELEPAPGGSMSTNSGLYIRQENENQVITKLLLDGKEVDTNTAEY